MHLRPSCPACRQPGSQAGDASNGQVDVCGVWHAVGLAGAVMIVLALPQFRRESEALHNIVAKLFPERADEDAEKLRASLSRQLHKYIGPIAGEEHNAANEEHYIYRHNCCCSVQNCELSADLARHE